MAQLKDLIVSGATRILGKTYSPEFIGKLTGNADTATKATSDSLNQNIANNYIKNLTINGRTITFIKGNGTTGTLTTQDTNTWRGIVNNLTSDSITDSLAAAQGKALKGLIDGKVAKDGTGATGTWGINISGTAAMANKMATYKQGSTTETYGAQYPLYAQWETGTVLKLKVDNYTVKVDYANKAAALDASAGSVTQPVYFSSGKPVQCSYYLQANIKTFTGSLVTAGWKNLNGKSGDPSITIAYNNKPANWNSGTYSASLVFGCSDTRGLLDCAYDQPIVTFGGTSYGGATDDNPRWYFKVKGTSGQTYTFPSASKTLCATDGSNASGTWSINISGIASRATLLAPAYSNSTFSTRSSTWRNGITDGYVVWGQAWVDTRLTSDSGDLTIWIKKVGSTTTANMTIDGTITSASGFIGSLSGNASTASKWATARTLTLTGSVTGSVNIDGSGNVSLATTTNHTHAYLPLSGGTLSGSFHSKPTASGSYNENIRIHPSPSNWTSIVMCGDDNTGDSGTSAKTWGIFTHNGVFGISKNGNGDSTLGAASLNCDANNIWHVNGNTILHSANYNSYAPTKTGGGASGTWGISITGNAASATTATNADKLDGYHRKGLYPSIPDWINANGYTKTITVNGDANTYYPVVIGAPLNKEGLSYVSIWKNLGSKTASYSGNHSNGTSSMWIIYEGRNWYWDGNGGYAKCWYYSMPYANLCAQTDFLPNAVGSYCVYLRGGGTDYCISTTYDCTPKVYYSTTNLGDSNYPANIAPRTSVGNCGRVSSTVLGYGNIDGNASTATALTSNAGSSTSPIYFSGGKPVTCGSTLSVSITGNAATATALASSAGSTGQPIYFNSGKPAAIDWHIGNSSTGEHNANNITYNMTGYYTSGGPSDLGNSTTDGAIYAQAYSSTWVAQMAQDYRNGNLFLRGKNNGTWKSWKAVLTSDYKPICFHWKGQDGQPVWLWGGTEPGTDMYVYNPSNFSVKYASSSGNADMVDGYHASSLWRSDGATWNPNANVSLNASDNSQEWSFDIRRNGKTGCYWHVWDSSLSSMLKVTADDGKVSAPYNFVGNLEGTAKTLAAGGNLNFPMTFNWSGQGGQPTWLWGGNTYSNIYVYNPSNFNVASSNKLNMQYNVVTSIANDTTSNWANMGCMCSFNTLLNQINGQPSQYGLIFSMGTPIDVHQIWMTQANGSIYHRGGNSAGWNGSWSRFLTANEDFYRPGSSFTVHLTCGGFCTEYAKNLYFTIPLDMPTSGVNGVSIRSSQGLIIRQNNKYLYGSGVSKYIYPSSYNARLSHGVIWVYATFGNSTNATNNSACGCTVDVVVTFS